MRSLAGLALTSSLLSLLSLLSACSRPQASVEPVAEAWSATPSVFVEDRGAVLPGFVELGPSCPASVGLAPTPFFGDSLLIRLPPEVDGEQIRQESRLARSPRPLTMGCADDLAASVFLARSYSNGSLAVERKRLFGDLNFPAQVEATILHGSDADDDISMSLSFPGDGVWGSTRVYLRMFTRYGRVYGVGFVADTSDYHRLEPVFAASANTMLAVPE